MNPPPRPRKPFLDDDEPDYFIAVKESGVNRRKRKGVLGKLLLADVSVMQAHEHFTVAEVRQKIRSGKKAIRVLETFKKFLARLDGSLRKPVEVRLCVRSDKERRMKR